MLSAKCRIFYSDLHVLMARAPSCSPVSTCVKLLQGNLHVDAKVNGVLEEHSCLIDALALIAVCLDPSNGDVQGRGGVEGQLEVDRGHHADTWLYAAFL